MPLYEYICEKCGKKFTLLKSVSASGEETRCPDCNSKARKVISPFACSSSSGFGQESGSSFSGGG